MASWDWSVEVARPRPDLHPDRLRPPRHFPPDLSQPEDAERAPVEAAGPGVLALLPLAPAEVGHLVGDPPVEREEQPHDQLGHRDRVLARAVADEDAEPRRGRHVSNCPDRKS